MGKGTKTPKKLATKHRSGSPGGLATPLGLLLCLMPGWSQAASLDGASLAVWWGLPFAGLLLSIALLPLLAPVFWHHHFGKITAAWGLAFVLPFSSLFGLSAAATSLVHALLAEYIPFVVLLLTLYIVAGGIHIRGNLHGSPGLNTGLLLLGTVLASFMGTTGASMLLIRPLLRANDNRRHQAHVVVFFIFLVSNVGGALTPLGDPPLFLGFLKGVEFFWPVRHLWLPTLCLSASLLVIFYLLDSWYFSREGVLPVDPSPDTRRLGIDGAVNFWLLGAVMGLVLLSGLWKPELSFNVIGTTLGLPSLVRDLGLLAVAGLSLLITAKEVHRSNQFSWAPMQEVAKLFAGIFMTIIPVMAMLAAGTKGPFGAIVAAVTGPTGQPDPLMYFWATGSLSAFLDNAPTYLVFFTTAGGNPAQLMGPLALTLAAISSGAVFMGALSYIGNAPNLMVKAVAEERGVPMPSFFGYMAWSCGVLLPLFVIISLIWFR